MLIPSVMEYVTGPPSLLGAKTSQKPMDENVKAIAIAIVERCDVIGLWRNHRVVAERGPRPYWAATTVMPVSSAAVSCVGVIVAQVTVVPAVFGVQV